MARTSEPLGARLRRELGESRTYSDVLMLAYRAITALERRERAAAKRRPVLRLTPVTLPKAA